MTTKSQQKLMQSLNFTEEDLAANRDGYMSEQQRERWRAKRRFTTNVFRLGQIILVFLLAGLVQLAVQQDRVIWLAFIGGLVVLGVLWALGDLLNPASDYRDDLRKGHVYSVCSKVKLTALEKAYRSYPPYIYKLEMETLTFRVNKNVWSQFHNQKQYCVYYMPDSKIILSAEVMD